MKPILLPVLALVLTAPALADTKEQAKDAIWAKELAIYAGRGRGDMEPYARGLAKDYAAWPPQAARPVHSETLKTTQPAAGRDKELLRMDYVDIAVNGDTAVIYYQTHRTRLADGTPADDRFEVTHTWVRQDGDWKVMGGMARPTPRR